MMQMKPAVIYIRVSTQHQAAEGVSLDAQLEAARVWCGMAGARVLDEFTDAGISGKRADNRPGLLAALDLACREKAILIVYSLSRLGRSTKDIILISERLGKAGADLVSLSEKIDTSSAAGNMVFQMLAVLAEFERKLASERTVAALGHKRRNGFKTGGTVPYGWDCVDGRLIENPEEQGTLGLIRSLRDQGLSLRKIAAALDEQGMKSKTGKPWESRTLKKILDRAA